MDTGLTGVAKVGGASIARGVAQNRSRIMAVARANVTMKRLNLPPNTDLPVLLFAERGIDKAHLDDVVRLFERQPGPVTVTAVRRPVELSLTAEGVLKWSTAFAKLDELRAEHNGAAGLFLMLITKSPNEDNWYAVQDQSNMRNGFGHVDDFRWVTSAPNSVITAHYILKGIFNALITDVGIPWMLLCHDEPRGCFFDFCALKEQLNLKLRTADICGDCMQIFREIGIPDALLQQTVMIMEACRPLALNTRQYRAAASGFDRWPFPVAVTRHKVVQATNPLLKFLLLLDHFDSLIRYFYLTREVLSGKSPVIEERPSLGWWLHQLAHSLEGEQHYREVVKIAQREGVVALRNERRGHGWMSADTDSYASEALRLEKIVTEIEGELAPFFETHRLVIPRQSEPHDDVYLVRGDSLTGSHLLHPPFEIELVADPRSVGLKRLNEIFVTDARMEKFHSISPHLRSAVCPTCHHPRVLITDGGHRYIDVFMGHRVELEPQP